MFQLLTARVANDSPVASSPESHPIQEQEQTLKVLHCRCLLPGWLITQAVTHIFIYTSQGDFLSISSSLCCASCSLRLRGPVRSSTRRPPRLTVFVLNWTAGPQSLWTVCSTCGGRRTAGVQQQNTLSKSANLSFICFVIS